MTGSIRCPPEEDGYAVRPPGGHQIHVVVQLGPPSFESTEVLKDWSEFLTSSPVLDSLGVTFAQRSSAASEACESSESFDVDLMSNR